MNDFEKYLRDYFPFGLPVSASCVDWLGLANLLNESAAIAKAGETQLLRQLAARFNTQCAANAPALNPVSPGQLITAAMIVELLRYVALVYCYQQNPGSLDQGLKWTADTKSDSLATRPIRAFVDFFPPRQVILSQADPAVYLQGHSEIAAHRELTAIESILLMLSMINPAFKPFRPFFDDSLLREAVPYRELVDSLATYFESQPPVDEVGVSLFKTLLAPMEHSPDSLEGQLDYIRRHWVRLLPASLLEKILLITDVLREERYGRGFSQGSLEVLRFGKAARLDTTYPEIEAFSHDADWMSNVVLIAKSTYVWLDQLAKKYQRPIHHLSDIPDEELDLLARWGFNGLWLIGVWERSRASQTIKQIMGNPEAMASAYSLYDYNIAHDLGGDEAYANLKERAWKRGIRLSADMVPNHMGIYSRWVVEHPHWFIQSPYPPFPVYQFSGTNLSDDPRIVLQIEDGYWQHRDAAVVFKRIDNTNGEVRYIYHGNDGTNMPWNDTAQLNFLMPEVREAVIQTILHVARKFPIIRFDAAMTLAKKHYQRLWFPQPGDGGAIPSRAEHGLTRDEFDAQIPKEFWREVVDRIKEELPETLLLAEAFWLMEGYFVRTLGMHRVYNSAFMNMLKMEENSKYRQTIKNVLEFSPEVLKRFVNFMNNPDERTAIEQFGKGDKYFGVCAMLVTMPGLPMIGHGQVEGYSEKYGMEYRRAYWDEHVDDELVRRHEAEIFPLMRKRHIFSGAVNFALHDFYTPHGWVDENVFAYTNRSGNERAVIIYNNAFNTTQGWIKRSTAINVGSGDAPHLEHRSVAEALALKTGDADLYIFKDYRTQLQFIRSGKQIADEGIYAHLNGYQYVAFLDWREIYDNDGSWRRVMHLLNGAGVHDIDGLFRESQLEPVLSPLRNLYNVELLQLLDHDFERGLLLLQKRWPDFMRAVLNFIGGDAPTHMPEVEEAGHVVEFEPEVPVPPSGSEPDKPPMVRARDDRFVAAAVVILQKLGDFDHAGIASDSATLLSSRFEDWLIRQTMTKALCDFYEKRGERHEGEIIGLLIGVALTSDNPLAIEDVDLQSILENRYVREFLQINQFEGKLWFNRERWLRLVSHWFEEVVMSSGESEQSGVYRAAKQSADQLRALAESSHYQVASLIRAFAVATRS